MVNRVAKGCVHVVQQCTCRRYERAFALKTESVKRGYIEVPAQFLCRSIERERPSVRVVRTQQFRRTVSRKRIFELGFGFEAFNEELTGGKVQHCYAKLGYRCNVIVGAII